ncbi:MAG: glycoside hydrolase family 127 protein, partial [Candidatus Omnitrophica bacterium]|nr:glycoside hydrolase family 127 protein [Candidatus Omnitrophota bacterium]
SRGKGEPVMTDYPIQPISFTSAHIHDSFWLPRLETNRRVTLPVCFQKCEETGRLSNFAKAAGRLEGPFQGIRFDDSDVFKVVEGAAYTLSLEEDPQLDAFLDRLIEDFAGAQEPDGYLYTNRTIDPEHPAPGAGEDRWSHLKQSHELYNIGHMYEAAVAHHRATDKDSFLDVAFKSANLVDQEFGAGKRQDPPGHQEIEIGLAKLYRVSGDPRYLGLAKFFLDARGRGDKRERYGEEMQDHLPVTEQKVAVGHAVRAGYMYSAMADVAALTGNRDYRETLDALWEDVVSGKLYLTGGIGARRHHESFGDPYELPNASAYNETCAAIANMFWNHRMFLLHGESKYMDIFERTLYNGFLSGVGMSGDRFFYPNPLATDGQTDFNQGRKERAPWFDCSCCPVNIVRFVPSLSGYIYAQKDDSIFVNLYIGGEAEIDLPATPVTLSQETDYPWDGKVVLTLNPDKEAAFTLKLRIPGWAAGQPVPSDLYSYEDKETADISIKVNGERIDSSTEDGYAILNRS